MERKLYYEALVQDKKMEVTTLSMTFKRTHTATFVVEKQIQTAGILQDYRTLSDYDLLCPLIGRMATTRTGWTTVSVYPISYVCNSW